MKGTGCELVAVRTAATFEAAAKIGPYQLVTGIGALDILSELGEAQLEASLGNCTLTSSVGPDANNVEDALDDISIRFEFDKYNRFFPTISGRTHEEVIWIMISQSLETPRLIALSTKDDFGAEVASWIDLATAEAAE